MEKEGITNRIDLFFSKNEIIIPIVLISIIVIGFNLEAVFGLESLLLDDQSRYSAALHGKLPWMNWGNLEISAYFRYPFWILLTISPYAARALVVVVWLIPISILAYYLFRIMLRLPRTVSLTASVIPMILPGQTLIPAFIDGIYMLPGLLFLLLAIILGIKALQSSNKSWHFILGSILTFYIAIETTELVVFSIFPIVLLFVYITRSWKRLTLLLSPLILIAVYRVIEVTVNPRSASTPAELNWEQIATRLKLSVSYVNPFGIIHENLLSFIVLTTVILTVLISLFLKSNEFLKLRANSWIQARIKPYVFFILFSVIWICALSFPFLFFSKYFPNRYLFFAAFGVSLIVSLAFYTILNTVFSKRKIFLIILFAGLILNSGLHRIEALKKFFYPFNNYHTIFKKELSAYTFPLNSQIVITGRSALPTGGYWIWSTGMLQYIIGRKDVSGIMPYEYNYYDPFNNEKGRTYSSKMTGLNLNAPIFFFRHRKTFDQKQYVMQWIDSDTIHVSWNLFRFDLKTGLADTVSTGNGYKDYLVALNSLKKIEIDQNDIMFGGIPTKADSIRLHIDN